MTWLDIVLLIFLLISTLIGLKAGIIKAILSLAGLAAGIALAGRYYAPLAGRLSFISDENVARIAAFAIIFIVVILAATILAAILKWFASILMLGWLNHLGGALLGFVVAALFSSALLVVWVKFIGISGPIADSYLAKLLLDRFPMVLALLPESFDSIRSFFQK